MIERVLTGALLAQPENETKQMVSESDIELIHALKNPPLMPLDETTIHVRRCRLAGDAIDAKGGKFRTEDLSRLLELVQGAPTLIGHNRNHIAVARFFGGEIEQHDEHSYIVPKLYWLKGHSRAEDLRLEIDGGLVNEASIAFLFRTPTCAICGNDIRECPHRIGELYDGKQCHYFYDGIEAVTEGSLVYRGAEPGTALLPNQLSSVTVDAIHPYEKSPLDMPRIRLQGKLWRLVEV
ncbi:MAG: hypothetical protein OEM52_11995 [bacterium]|nr:hypothetical protein [bacterium]